jgi:hypothetical protein
MDEMSLQVASTVGDDLQITVKNTFLQFRRNDSDSQHRVRRPRLASAPAACFDDDDDGDDLLSHVTDVAGVTDTESSLQSWSPRSLDGIPDGTKIEAQMEASSDNGIVINVDGEQSSRNSIGREPLWVGIGDDGSDADLPGFETDQVHDTNAESSLGWGTPFNCTSLWFEPCWVDAHASVASLEAEAAQLRARAAQLRLAAACVKNTPQHFACTEPTEDGSHLSGRTSGWVQQCGVPAYSFIQYGDSCSRTTVMFRNLPNNYTRDMLIELLEEQGFRGCFDFIYLPIDFKTQSGLGYAFINLISHCDASRALNDLPGFQNWRGKSQKRLQVSWSSLQGLQANVNRYRNSVVMHPEIPEIFKPMIFNGGVSVSFPAPTKAIPPLSVAIM